MYDAMDYPPTMPELDMAAEPGEIGDPFKRIHGRIVFQGRESLIEAHELREALFPRKIRRARRIARFLARLDGVRFVALCNTTALAHARDEGDLDFFVITRTGSLMQARGWATLRYMFARPGAARSERDAVCLSYFIDDSALDLALHMLPDGDPYFQHWFLSLLPLYDDGILSDFWNANSAIRTAHPHARPWIIAEDLRVNRPRLRIPTPVFLESLAGKLQERVISGRLKDMRNKDTRVIMNEHVLKFHADDGRQTYKDRYAETCRRYGVAP